MSIATRDEGRNRGLGINPSVKLGNGHRWFVVHTLSFGEARAQANLENQNFRAFLPKRQKTIRHARKLTTTKVEAAPEATAEA